MPFFQILKNYIQDMGKFLNTQNLLKFSQKKKYKQINIGLERVEGPHLLDCLRLYRHHCTGQVDPILYREMGGTTRCHVK